jgi:hypothetical protein
MAKVADEIIEWGTLKPFFDKTYNFNSIDIETIDNEIFMLGYIERGNYHYTLKDFYNTFNDLIIKSVQYNRDILTWTRYDNTHLLKLLIKDVDPLEQRKVLLRVGKINPVFKYNYKSFIIIIEAIIRDSMIIKVKDEYGKERSTVIYNLKNLYGSSDLETVASNYNIDYYTKIGSEYHIIDYDKYFNDSEYRNLVIKANKLDNMVIIDIANRLVTNFKQITGVYPKTIFSNGSLARSYLLSYMLDQDDFKVQFQSIFRRSKLFNELLDYSMRSYHGGKIESYIIGYVPNAKIIDITSAYPYSLSLLPKLTGRTYMGSNLKLLDRFYYAFIRCDVYIKDKDFIHPITVQSPINKANISPYGYLEDIVITKVEYDYLLKYNVEVQVHDFIGVYHVEDNFPYRNLMYELFEKRNENRKKNESLSGLYKELMNSQYGITYELTPIHEEDENGINYVGLRAGDFFNPVIASYITALTRTYLSEVSYNIRLNGGNVYLNMTDSIIYSGEVTLDVFSDVKTLGKFEPPEIIKDIVIIGAGRYEYYNEMTKRYTLKSRGFSIKRRDKAFYRNLDLTSDIKIPHNTFVTAFKATTNKYSYRDMGHLIDDEYSINPFNLGGKRIIDNPNIDINKHYTTTSPLKMEKGLL